MIKTSLLCIIKHQFTVDSFSFTLLTDFPVALFNRVGWGIFLNS